MAIIRDSSYQWQVKRSTKKIVGTFKKSSTCYGEMESFTNLENSHIIALHFHSLFSQLMTSMWPIYFLNLVLDFLNVSGDLFTIHR